MRDLLVASAGGHLQQLYHLLPRLNVSTSHSLWVTYDAAQSRSLLASHEVVHAYHPTTRNLPNAVRNLILARGVLDGHDIGRVISTGAAVAVPFIFVASRREIPCHYIESATRVTGPSLTGRVLQQFGRIHLYRQLGSWGAPRWRRGPNVFDEFTSQPISEQQQVRRVVVSLGTHTFPFRALVDRLAAILDGRDIEITWQLGSTPPADALPGRVVATLPAEELQHLIESSDVVVGHAGTGLALTALSAGHIPVLVPRHRRRHEHTDDHQSQIANELDRRSLAITPETGELTYDHLLEASRRRVVRLDPAPFELVE